MANNNVTAEIPPVPRPTARDEWEDFIETLHRTGTLRTLNGLVGQIAEVTEVLLDQANAPPGRNLIGTAAVLGDLAASVDAESLQPLANSLREAAAQAHGTLNHKPPNTARLLRLLHDKDTRRVLGAGLVFLKTLGQALPPEIEEQRAD